MLPDDAEARKSTLPAGTDHGPRLRGPGESSSWSRPGAAGPAPPQHGRAGLKARMCVSFHALFSGRVSSFDGTDPISRSETVSVSRNSAPSVAMTLRKPRPLRCAAGGCPERRAPPFQGRHSQGAQSCAARAGARTRAPPAQKVSEPDYHTTEPLQQYPWAPGLPLWRLLSQAPSAPHRPCSDASRLRDVAPAQLRDQSGGPLSLPPAKHSRRGSSRMCSGGVHLRPISWLGAVPQAGWEWSAADLD